MVEMATLCASCGKDLTDRQSDRRSLETAAAASVLEAWRDFLKSMGREDADSELLKSGKMCRSCYSSYERYQKLRGEIHTKLLGAVGSVNVGTARNTGSSCSTPTRKRPSTPAAKRFHHQDSTQHGRHHYSPGHTSSSPIVTVSCTV